MSQISSLEQDRNSVPTRDYVNFMRQRIEAKLESLEALREKLVQYRYKLDQVEEIERIVNG